MASDEELRRFQNDLAASPNSGDLIQGTGGLRKARFRLAGRGKSGSARVIYLWLPHAYCLILFHFYTKQSKADLSADDKKPCAKPSNSSKNSTSHENPASRNRV